MKKVFLLMITGWMIHFTSAQELTGEYFIQTFDGKISLELAVDERDNVMGSFTTYNGMRYRLTGKATKDMAEGRLTGITGISMFFEAFLRDGVLKFNLFPAKPNGEPDFASSQKFVLERKETNKRGNRKRRNLPENNGHI